MRGFPLRIPLLALFLTACAAELPAQAVPLQGSFTLVPEQSDDVEEAIRQATARINFALRAIARGRLRRTNPAYRSITIAHTTSDVTVITEDRAPITTPASGSPVEWSREDGEVFDVSTTWEGDRLLQRFEAEDGERVNLFWLDPDSQMLRMEVTVSSPRLPVPLTYTLAFRRDS